MSAGSVLMFVLATLHVAINGFRTIRGFVDFGTAPGGPAAFLGDLSTWHHIFKDVLYTIQCLLGDGMAVYRCWILWNREYKFVLLPFCMFLTNAVSGCMIIVLFTDVGSNASIFDPRLTIWITVFYSMAVAQNLITTGLMSLRLWQRERESSRFRLGGGVFVPVLRILVGSAALYLFVEIPLLSLYAMEHNSQYILLEAMTPTIGITFGMVTIRTILRPQDSPDLCEHSRCDAATVGGIQLRRISMNIATQTEDGGHEKGSSV
ncbi:hypothetical protein C8R45DRAFT_121674 [Mycena sanguinolenta]|nr:hypothetical protein C8R45DRAFT_121674 [Mycena sanguinolenta]